MKKVLSNWAIMTRQNIESGVDCGIAYGCEISGNDVVGIVQGHRICHASAEHSAGQAEVEAEEFHGHRSHDQDGDYCDEEAETYPHQTFGTHDGVEELCACVEAETGEIEREADAAQHEVGTSRGVGDETELWPETTDENADDDRTSGQTGA